MIRKQYDFNFKRMIVDKGKEIGNMTAVARQHELDPKMVLRWARQLNHNDLDQLDGASLKLSKFIPTAEDYAALEKENEKLRRQHGLVINKKKVYRLCKQMSVLRPQRKLKIKHSKRLANNRVITGSNQLPIERY